MNPERWNELIQIKIKKDKAKYEENMEAATDTFNVINVNKKNVLIIKCKRVLLMNL